MVFDTMMCWCVCKCRAGLRVREKNCTEKLKIPPTYPFVSFRHSSSHLNRSLPLLSANRTPRFDFLSFYDPWFFIDKDEINKEYVAPSWKMRIIHPILYVSIPANTNLINMITLIFTPIMNPPNLILRIIIGCVKKLLKTNTTYNSIWEVTNIKLPFKQIIFISLVN